METSGERRGNGLEPIESVIGRVLGTGRLGRSAHVAELWSGWREIVGEIAADHCSPEKIENGKLYVKVDSPVWRQQLDLLKEEIKGKIDQKIKNCEIKKIVFR
jgi:predicted nucleic acid-binding Zn ribbon protein